MRSKVTKKNGKEKAESAKESVAVGDLSVKRFYPLKKYLLLLFVRALFSIFVVVKKTLTRNRMWALLASVVLLAPAWLGFSGLSLLVALTPLLCISSSFEDTRRGWWGAFLWALMVFVGWSVTTVWWIWNATPVGPVAATLFTTFWCMLAFMLYHTVSKRAPKSVAYTLLVSGWISAEYLYMQSDFSWPWLTLGNGFSHNVTLVQWYEYTGVYGGTLWVLISNVLIYEAWMQRRRVIAILAGLWIIIPIVISGVIYVTFDEPEQRGRVTILQPNVDCYDKFNTNDEWQEQNLMELLCRADRASDFIVAPETALTRHMNELTIDSYPHLQLFIDTLKKSYPQTTFVSGANTVKFYNALNRTATSRAGRGYYYDHFNSAIGVDSAGVQGIYHKGKLVIGVENTPTWVFKALDFLVVDLGGVLGQIGHGGNHQLFISASGVKAGPAICYEGLYGDFYGEFVRQGADLMFIVSNDGWWGDTPGYKHLFSFTALRAIEHRRSVARSANTGQSGFFDCRGLVVGPTLGWDERGVITYDMPINEDITLYTRYGDYIARISLLVFMLTILYYIAYRVKRKNLMA